MINPEDVIVMYIIHETLNNRDIYRIKDTVSGRMTDTTLDIVDKFSLDCSNAEKITINSLGKYSGYFKRGINDLDTWCRIHNRLGMLDEYNNADNELKATEISRGSVKKVNWVCNKCGNKWSTVLNIRVRNESNCPECMIKAGKYRVHTEENNFVNKAKELGLDYLLKEIQLPANIDINELYASDKKSYTWQCVKCHREFNNCIVNRFRGQKCPYCSKTGTSIPEQVIYLALKKYYPDTLYRYKFGKYESDIYIPSVNTIIDYRGMYYHKDREYIDDLKESIFKENGFNQIIILASNEYHNIENNNYIYFDGKDFTWLLSTIYNRLKLNNVIDENITNKVIDEAVANRSQNRVINCVAETNPELLEIWDDEANKGSGITLYNVTKGTKYKAWFRCKKCGKSYYAFIRKQVIGQRCPICNGTNTITGVNDLATTNAYILKAWDFDKNNEIGVTPYSVKAGSLKRVFIKCSNCGMSSDYQVRDIVNRARTIKCNRCKHKFFE